MFKAAYGNDILQMGEQGFESPSLLIRTVEARNSGTVHLIHLLGRKQKVSHPEFTPSRRLLWKEGELKAFQIQTHKDNLIQAALLYRTFREVFRLKEFETRWRLR